MQSGERLRAWVKRLPAVVAALNNEVTRLIGKKPVDDIMAKVVTKKPSSVIPGRPVGLKEILLPSDAIVCYLYQPGELEGGQRRRATDAVWSLKVYKLARAVSKSGVPVVYYLEGGPLVVSFVKNCW